MATAMLLAACSKETLPAPVAMAAPPSPPVTDPAPVVDPARVMEDYSRKAFDRLNAGRNVAGQYSDVAKKALENLDLGLLKTKAAALLEALERKDFTTAEKAARDVDANLGSDVVSRSVQFLQIEARDGAAAAAAAVEQYLQRPDIPATQKEHFIKFKEGLSDPRTKRGVELACGALLIGCDIKYGHEGAAIAAAVVGMLFDEKEGIFKDYGILRQPSPPPTSPPLTE